MGKEGRGSRSHLQQQVQTCSGSHLWNAAGGEGAGPRQPRPGTGGLPGPGLLQQRVNFRRQNCLTFRFPRLLQHLGLGCRVAPQKRKMPFHPRKLPLDIPSPTETDWIKTDEEDNLFVNDPEKSHDSLPQPFRMISKLVTVVLEEAWEVIKGKDREELQKQELAPTLYQPSAEFQVVGTANCMVASSEYIFIGLSAGLFVFSISTCEKVCAWEAAKLEICAIRASDLGNGSHLLGSVDELGCARLFYFFKENLLHIKAINEVEDISKRTACTELEISRGGDYAGFLLQGDAEVWLEIYRLPKESWLKEIQTAAMTPLSAALPAGYAKEAAATSQIFVPKTMDMQGTGTEDTELQQQLLKAESRLGPPVLLLKVRAPKPLAGSIFKNPFEALMKSDDGHGIGLGNNHLIKESQWEWQETVFTGAFHQYLETEDEQESREEKPSHAVFHFHLPGRILPMGTETKVEPDMPVAFSVHWSRSQNLCFYFLSRPPKEKLDSDPKPDVVWPCAAPITCSATTPCSSYLAFACEDGAITVWDKSLGFPLSVTMLPGGSAARSIQFMPRSSLPSEKTSYSYENLPSAKVQLLVLCTDGSLHLITSGTKEFNTKLLGCRPESPGQTISTVSTVSALPNAVLIFSRDGTIGLMDVATQENLCHFIPRPPYRVVSPWQPIFTVDSDGQYLILKGEELSGGVKAETDTIFLFNFKSYPFMEKFLQNVEFPSDSVDHLRWDTRTNRFLKDSLEQLSTISQQMPECWSQLQTYAATLQAESLEK
ncbi:WD repeat-containing protein 93 [Hemicordylus capensis]|uniref:WD repeat-containing protein 93 n=1 Tax=Hemicordylus capensis TaxID=884348 RepID=UPI00230281C7|nr:WD repeat-containing protein 93 [Hemicordylus capensis]